MTRISLTVDSDSDLKTLAELVFDCDDYEEVYLLLDDWVEDQKTRFIRVLPDTIEFGLVNAVLTEVVDDIVNRNDPDDHNIEQAYNAINNLSEE